MSFLNQINLSNAISFDLSNSAETPLESGSELNFTQIGVDDLLKKYNKFNKIFENIKVDSEFDNSSLLTSFQLSSDKLGPQSPELIEELSLDAIVIGDEPGGKELPVEESELAALYSALNLNQKQTYESKKETLLKDDVTLQGFLKPFKSGASFHPQNQLPEEQPLAIKEAMALKDGELLFDPKRTSLERAIFNPMVLNDKAQKSLDKATIGVEWLTETVEENQSATKEHGKQKSGLVEKISVSEMFQAKEACSLKGEPDANYSKDLGKMAGSQLADILDLKSAKAGLMDLSSADNKLAAQKDLEFSRVLGQEGSTPQTNEAKVAPHTSIAATESSLRTAANASALAAPVVVYSKNWQGDFIQRIQWMVNQGIDQVELQLDPQELGPLTIKISMHNGESQVAVHVAHSQTRDIFDANQDRLKELFQQGGLSLSQFDVKDQSSQSHNEKQQRDQLGDADESLTTGDEVVISSPTLNMQGRLDYFI